MAAQPHLERPARCAQDPLRRPLPRLTPTTTINHKPRPHTHKTGQPQPGRRFANQLDFQLQLDAWFEKANQRTHKTLRARPIDRLIEERAVMRALPAREPDVDRRWVVRVPPDPHVRFDTNDYSLDPDLVGRRVELRASQRELIAVALDTGELAGRHERSFAKHRTITALEHARALRKRRGEPDDDIAVEQRPLARYDRLLA